MVLVLESEDSAWSGGRHGSDSNVRYVPRTIAAHRFLGSGDRSNEQQLHRSWRSEKGDRRLRFGTVIQGVWPNRSIGFRGAEDRNGGTYCRGDLLPWRHRSTQCASWWSGHHCPPSLGFSRWRHLGECSGVWHQVRMANSHAARPGWWSNPTTNAFRRREFSGNDHPASHPLAMERFSSVELGSLPSNSVLSLCEYSAPALDFH